MIRKLTTSWIIAAGGFIFTCNACCIIGYAQNIPRTSRTGDAKANANGRTTPAPGNLNQEQPESQTETNPDPTAVFASHPPKNLSNTPSSPRTIVVESGYLSSKEYIMAATLSVIGVTTLFIQFFLLKKSKLKPEEVLRVFGITFILIGILIFIIAGFDAAQIAPAMGLFGTIAGYLLGRKENEG